MWSKLLTLLLFSVGGLVISGVVAPGYSIKSRIQAAAARMRQQARPKTERVRDYVSRIDGTARESLMLKSRREAQRVYEQTGQTARFTRTLRLSLLSGGAGCVVGLLLGNPLLAVVLAVGFYYLPLWLSQFALYRYNRFLCEELETALNLVTTSYLRTNDILGAVEENLCNISEPVKAVFAAFINNLKYVDPNAPAQIERMKGALDNHIWRQWCDGLVLCQSNHNHRATLPPIVGKFSNQKAQQQENETKMMLPLRNAVMMICMVLSVIPLFLVLNDAWYANLVSTPFGQLSLVVTAVVVLATINKAIRLSKPIEYDV